LNSLSTKEWNNDAARSDPRRCALGFPQGGRQFALLAAFPVTGDVNQLAGFDVQITNSAGSTKTQRITF
jgi:hypothetical protein